MYYRNKPTHSDEKYHHTVKENFIASKECKFPLWLLIVIVILILIAGGLLIYQLMHKKATVSSGFGSYTPHGQGYSQKQRFGYNFI